MRRLVSIMLRSLPELVNTLIFMLFFFIVFGIIGIQTFYGVIYQRCRFTEKPFEGEWRIDPAQSSKICSINPNSKTSCDYGTFCTTPINYDLEHLSGDFYDYDPWRDEIILYNSVNFNNILVAVVAVFEALTLEGWSTQMENLVDSGVGELAIIFYLLVVAFGSYFILNLILAVIMGSFTKFEKQEIENSMQEAEKKDDLMK